MIWQPTTSDGRSIPRISIREDLSEHSSLPFILHTISSLPLYGWKKGRANDDSPGTGTRRCQRSN